MQTNILEYMDKSVAACPDKVAFSDGDCRLTFRELGEQSDAVGTYLAAVGIGKAPVIVFMGRHPHTIAAFLGVVRGGCFYVPVDAEMPRIRIMHILENLAAPLMICDERTQALAKELAFSGRIVLYQDISQTTADEAALAGIAARAIDSDPVYIVHTSGSTGVPKGVVACHRSVIDYIEQLSPVLGINGDTIFGNQTPLYFDACLKEIYPTLKYGATTYLIPPELFMQPVRLIEFLNDYRINTICWVVSAMTMISALGAFDAAIPEYLVSVNFGSEVFPIREFNKWRAALPDARFVNLYGPTECTGMCCYFVATDLPADAKVIPIGRPFRNTEVLVLGEDGERVAIGESGELCIRGASLTLGYYNDFEKTAAAFVQNPLNRHYPEPIYRSGDMGYLGEDGELYFCSRRDHQIKHMGHRIELGEIEAAVLQVAEVAMAACVYDGEKNKIRLFYSGQISAKEVTAKLREWLPRYMLPNAVRQLEALPLTANGKIDRACLVQL